MSDIFLLTRPPKNPRAELCFKLLRRSEEARLYLCGGGIYCLLDGLADLLPSEGIFACKEDTDARGVQAEQNAVLPADFYRQLVEDIVACSGKVYAF